MLAHYFTFYLGGKIKDLSVKTVFVVEEVCHRPQRCLCKFRSESQQPALLFLFIFQFYHSP